MYNGINISEGTLISSCGEGEEMIIPRVRKVGAKTWISLMEV